MRLDQIGKRHGRRAAASASSGASAVCDARRARSPAAAQSLRDRVRAPPSLGRCAAPRASRQRSCGVRRARGEAPPGPASGAGRAAPRAPARARRARVCGAVEAERGERMLERAPAASRPRAPASAVSATSRASTPGGVRAERPAGGIVDLDPPALQLDRDAARQAAIRRDQRRDLSRRLGRLAQDDGDGERLLALVRGLDDARRPSSASAFSRADSAASLAPALGRVRPAASLRRRSGSRRCSAALRLAERLDIARARTPSVSSSSFRPYCGWPAPAGSRSLGPIARPASVVEPLVEAGQHDRAVRQAGDRREQRRRGRHRAGRAGGDDRSRRAVAEQPLRLARGSACRGARRDRACRARRDAPARTRWRSAGIPA